MRTLSARGTMLPARDVGWTGQMPARSVVDVLSRDHRHVRAVPDHARLRRVTAETLARRWRDGGETLASWVRQIARLRVSLEDVRGHDGRAERLFRRDTLDGGEGTVRPCP